MRAGDNHRPVAGIETIDAGLGAEMAAYDRLGPRARRALQEASIKVAAVGIAAQLQARGLAADHPAVDADIAASVALAIRQVKGAAA